MGDIEQDRKGNNGPIPKRKVNDVIFLILFLIFWVGMFIIAGFSFKYGNLNRLKYGTDSYGNLCGTSNTGFANAIDATQKPYLLLTQPWHTGSLQLCVSQCPSLTPPADNAYTQLVCKYDYAYTPVSNSDAANKVSDGHCFWPIASTSALHRCIPAVLVSIATDGSTSPANSTATDSNLNARGVATEIWSDIVDTWKIILISCFITIILAFVWLVIIRWFAPVVVWTTVILATSGMWCITGYFWYAYYCATTNKPNNYLYSGGTTIDSAVYNRNTLLALSIIAAIITVPLTLFVLAARSRIKIAIAVIIEASKAIRSLPTLMLMPFIKNIALSFVFGWCLWILLLLASSGTNIATYVNSSQAVQTGQSFQPSTVLNFLQIYYILGLFWSYWLLLAILQTTIAGAVGAWYWSLDKSAKGLPKLPVLGSFGRVMRYHLGSLAFGSLIIALLSTARVVLAYISHQAKKASDNKLLKMVLACLQCCLACLESFLKFLNTNAYIEVAVYGTAFLPSAKRAFDLLWRNAFRVVVVNRVSAIILFLGKVLIVLLTTLMALGMSQSKTFLSVSGEDITGRYWSLTIILIIILSWMIASSFTAVLDMAIDTIFLCFCEDSEKNDGSAEKPYYMPPDLRALMASPKAEAEAGLEVSEKPAKGKAAPAPAATQAKAYY